MSVDKNIKLINRFTILVNAGFIIPVIVLYYRDEMGLSFQDFLIGEACFAAVVVLLEVPTGWISDVWRRKHVLALGAFFNIIGYACLMVGDSLIWAIAAQSIIGIGISLMSGTHSAMLYDTLLSAGRAGEFRKREGKRGALQFYSVAAASVAGGVTYPIHHMLPLLLTFAALIGAIICAAAMDEPERHKRRPEKHPLADMVETARYALHGHAEVGLIILFAAIMFCGTKLIMWSQQPYYMLLGLHESVFGVMMAAGFMLAGMSSHISHWFDGKLNSMKVLAAIWIVAIGVCLGAGLVVGWHGVILLMIGGSCLYGIANPRVSEAINSRVGSERRATILSTQALLSSLFFIPVSSGLGWLSQHHGIGVSLVGIAAWLGVAGIALTFAVIRRGHGKRLLML